MTNAEIKSLFVQEIIEGKISFNDVKKRIQEYEEKYGADFFADYEIEKKDKPWNEEYFNELKKKSIAMTSKQFILHLSEVSEYVHEHETHQNNNKKKAGIISVIASLIVLILILVFNGQEASAMTVIANQIAIIEYLKI